jgi:hypothetical protein
MFSPCPGVVISKLAAKVKAAKMPREINRRKTKGGKEQ